MKKIGVKVTFIDSDVKPRIFENTSWWTIGNHWVSIIDEIEFDVVTREKKWGKIVETTERKVKKNTICMIDCHQILSVEEVEL